MEPNTDPANNYMNLMRDWYDQSGKLLHLMMNSFAYPGESDRQNVKEGSPADGLLNENLWTYFMTHFERILNELGTTYGFNKDLFEGVMNSWKEFSDSMGRYFTPPDDQDPNSDLKYDVWKKWFDYSNSMNRQILEGYYNLNNRNGEAGGQETPEGQSGTQISAGALFGNKSYIDDRSLNDMNDIVGRYYSDVTKELLKVNEGVLYRNESSVEKSQEFIENWSGMYNRFLSDLIRTPAYNIMLNDNLKRSLDAKTQIEEALADNWRMLGLPTRTDILELHREMHDLNLRMNRLAKKIDSIEVKKPGNTKSRKK